MQYSGWLIGLSVMPFSCKRQPLHWRLHVHVMHDMWSVTCPCPLAHCELVDQAIVPALFIPRLALRITAKPAQLDMCCTQKHRDACTWRAILSTAACAHRNALPSYVTTLQLRTDLVAAEAPDIPAVPDTLAQDLTVLLQGLPQHLEPVCGRQIQPMDPRIPDMHTSAQVWILRHLATQQSPTKSTASDSTHVHSMAAWHTRLFVMAPSTQNSSSSHQPRIAPCSTAWPQQCRSKPDLSKSPPTASIKHSTYTSIHRIIGCCTQTHLLSAKFATHIISWGLTH